MRYVTRVFTWMALIALAAAVWLVAASYLFLSLRGLSGMVEEPWKAWWVYKQSDYSDIRTRGYLALSAVVAAAILLAVVSTTVRVRGFGAARRKLYGDSTWAQRREMQKGGVRRTGTLF
jgi:type IV secretory pathway TraG/TraD family ATPase VirD4